MNDFVVIDTEGKELSEIAILNSQGKLIYEAFVKDELNNEGRKINAKSLKEIVENFLTLVESKLIICHYAAHDIEVLKNSFQKVNLKWPNLKFACSFELAKEHFPGLKSYSLDYLSKHLNLSVNNQYFNSNRAHTAQYDAQFTYQLYLKTLMTDKPNPFGTSRVDTPFQNHADLKEISQNEFETLKSILTDIKHDPNFQSKGAVVIGEAGSGKTHLMMRLAKELLKNNRLLFIRQPNNPNAVLFHIYSRILESFVEMIPNTDYSQLEYLLAHSFSQIIIEILNKKDNLTKNRENILKTLSSDPLNIYKVLGKNTENKRKSWLLIEKLTLDWWANKYGFGGYSASIIKGLIKFCSYSDPHKRDLVRKWLSGNQLEASELSNIKLDNWSEEISQEEFSLEAIAVFAKLSLADEPLIIIFDQLEGLKYHEQLLFRFGEAVKEIFTHVPNSLIITNLFPDRWAHLKTFLNNAIVDRMSQYELRLNIPTQDKLKCLLALKAQAYDLEIDQLFKPQDLEVILNQNSIRRVFNWASHYYRHQVDGIPLPHKTRSFEEEVREEFQTLKDEIAWLKQHIKAPVQQNKAIEVRLITPTNDEQQVRDYLNQQKALLEQEYQKNVIISDFDDIGKVITTAEAFKTFKAFETDCLRLGKRKVPEHLLIKTQLHSFVIAFLQVSGSNFTSRLKNFNQLVVNHKDVRFGLFRDVRETTVSGKVGKEEIEKLNNASNGSFIYMEKEDRLSFELIYKLIVDIQNQDFEIDLQKALTSLENVMSDFWLIKLFKGA
ncbi:exonuclease [Candidatus Thiomargarita nelsonii]|uniref:Exonuclease n=1 Tax=Candidatus Thiomargarita nelsonii TaxID=1003181 RepID=A0A4E0RT80_9GAMM|nr:exonuclease [Candidatus Thiomargarita nelsonii]